MNVLVLLAEAATAAGYVVLAAAGGLTLLIVARQLALTLGAASLPPCPTTPRPAPVADAALPRVSIIVPAHNEAAVIEDSLRAVARTNYPADLLDVVVVNDRSTDGTGAIVDRLAREHGVIRPLHRPDDAMPGKSAALRDALATTDADVFVFFDADYLPAPQLVRQLVAPFSDPTVGATMGRVVPVNSGSNLLTRLIDLERRGGYVVDQQMRQRWRLLPQFGGTVGAVRASALAAVGGWQAGHMTEDTHLTYALFLHGYRVVYLNGAACYEETPEDWRVRYKQVRRWSYGHNACLLEFLAPVLRAPGRGLAQRLDAALVLLFYLYPPLVLLALPLAITAPALLGAGPAWLLLPLAPLFCGFGNLAPFFQIMIAAWRDRQPHVLAILPLLPVSSAINMLAASHGLLQLVSDRLLRRSAVWDKTARYRREPHAPTPAAQHFLPLADTVSGAHR